GSGGGRGDPAGPRGDGSSGGRGRRPGLLCRGAGDPQRQPRWPAAAAGRADGPSPVGSAAVPPAEPGGEKRGSSANRLAQLAARIDAGLAAVAEDRVVIGQQVADVRLVAATLDPERGGLKERRTQFAALQKQFAQSDVPFHEHLRKLMANWKPGLFAGGKAGNVPWDNLDLERDRKSVV